MPRSRKPAPVPEKLAAARRALARLEARENVNQQLVESVREIVRRYEREVKR